MIFIKKFFKKSFKLKTKKNLSAGFSFVELIIIVSIFGVLSGVVLFRFSDFSGAVSLGNLTRDIALVIKRAQTEASSGRFSVSDDEGNIPSYGVYFDVENPDSFIYFSDNGSADEKSKTFSPFEEIETIQIDTPDRISGICLVIGGNCIEVDDLHITFIRPYLDASIVSTTPPGYASYIQAITEARIEVISASEQTREIIISPIGQIRVE